MEKNMFKKSVFGGYDCDEVEENIRILKDDLHIAKKSFDEKLEEYASNLSMVSLERDKMAEEAEGLKEKLNNCHSEIEALKENLAEAEKVKESLINGAIVTETGMEVKEILKQNEELKTLLDEAKEEWEKVCEKNQILSAELMEFKKMAADLKAENRNLAMSVDMKVSDYKRRTELNMEKVSDILTQIQKVLDEIKADEEKLP